MSRNVLLIKACAEQFSSTGVRGTAGSLGFVSDFRSKVLFLSEKQSIPNLRQPPSNCYPPGTGSTVISAARCYGMFLSEKQSIPNLRRAVLQGLIEQKRTTNKSLRRAVFIHRGPGHRRFLGAPRLGFVSDFRSKVLFLSEKQSIPNLRQAILIHVLARHCFPQQGAVSVRETINTQPAPSNIVIQHRSVSKPSMG